jgi:hypothetical protein
LRDWTRIKLSGYPRTSVWPILVTTAKKRKDRGDRVCVTVLLNTPRLVLIFLGVASLILIPVLRLFNPVLRLLREFLYVTVTPK